MVVSAPMVARVACLSPYDEAAVRAWFKGRHEVEVVLVPDPPDQPAVTAACADADLVIADRRHKHRIDRAVLEHMRRCKLVQQAAVGFDTVDHRAAAELGIPVANAGGYNREAVADWTVMAMLALVRNSFWADRQLRAGRWGPDDRMRDGMVGHELGAVTVGIVGFGNVGAAVARRLSGFGSRVLFTDVVRKDVTGAEQVSLESLLGESDLVSIHSPLDDDSRGLIDANALAKMKEGSFLVNAARGPIVDEGALIAALRSRHLGGAALDVFEAEPLAADSPLRALDNVILSPHVGGATREAEIRLDQLIGENLLRVLDGQQPLSVVNGVEAKAIR